MINREILVKVSRLSLEQAKKIGLTDLSRPIKIQHLTRIFDEEDVGLTIAEARTLGMNLLEAADRADRLMKDL